MAVEPAPRSISDLFDLTGRVALVTGGTRGLGLQMAMGLAEAGAAVALVSEEPARMPDAARDFLAKAPDRRIALKADVTDAAAVEAAVAVAVDRLGGLDICLTSAGINASHALAVADEAAWQRIMAVNVTGTFLTVAAALAPMRRRGGGSIITVSSIYGLVGMDRTIYEPDRAKPFAFPAYQASKGAVVNFTRELACSLGADGIRANCICPATFVSDQNRHILAGEVLRRVQARTPLGRTGAADDLKGAAVFLASDASAYVTGVALPVDGGWTAW